MKSNGFVWSTSDKAGLRATSLYLIRAIAEKHGCTADVDLKTDTINIDCPEEVDQGKLVLELQEQVGGMVG